GVVSIIVGLGICVVTGLSYLMPSLPVWDTPLLPIFYICNAAFLGGVSCMIIAGATKCEDAYRWTSMIALFGALAQAIVLIIYAVYITNLGSSYTDVTYYFDPTMPDSAIKDTDAIMASLLTGSNALAYWLGVMVIGIIVPVVFTILALVQKGTDAKRMIWYGIISLVCCVVGSIIWRCLLYVLATYVLPFF
ncbi:MAG: hypothetical protein LUB61_03620, partial [Eggerthellaceae bacterium]|nr:hypothetical protein [Eggerthellaceae bacterium]